MDICLEQLIRNLALDVRLDSSTVSYITRRLKSEGLPFLTVTLPKLAKSVIRSLELGYFDRSNLTDFAWKRRSLRYFRSLLDGIFCQATGRVLTNVSADSILRLRQLCEYCYKLAIEFTDEAKENAVENFLKVEDELAAAECSSFHEQLRKDFETYYPEISRSTVESVYQHSRPRSGPGTWSGMGRVPYYIQRTTEHYSGGCSTEFKAYSGYFKEYPGCDLQPSIVGDTAAYSELLLVPKDSRGPRVIVREPFFRLKSQLAFFDWITAKLERVSRNRINFYDQAINRDLARQSSIDKKYATIDLKDASDRVNMKVVNIIFRNSPAVRYFTSRRTKSVKLPNGDLLQLKKLSGMGSGLTFPIMSLIAHLSITRQIVARTGVKYHAVRKHVFTYGDDIIVPARWYNYACEGLTQAGLLVNSDKSFVNSHFRESCGGDYWNGHSVGPVRLRLANSAPKYSRQDQLIKLTSNPAILQVERHCRELVRAGLHATADYLYAVIERTLKKRLPAGTGKTPYLCRYSENAVAYPAKDGNHMMVKAILPLPAIAEVARMNPYYHLGKFLSRSSEITTDVGSWWEQLSSGDSTYGVVSVPRTVRYKRATVSGYALMG